MSNLPPFLSNTPIGQLGGDGLVRPHPTFTRWLEEGLRNRVGGNEAKTNIELEQELANFSLELTDIQTAVTTLTGEVTALESFANALQTRHVWVEETRFASLAVGSDWTPAFNAAIAELTITGGTVLFSGDYSITGLVKPNNVSLIGSGVGSSSLTLLSGSTAPAINDYPLVGTSSGTGTRSLIGGFVLYGGNVGVIKFRGTVTLGSDLITAPDSTEGIQAGYLLSGVGIPADTTVLTVGASIQMSAVATVDNTQEQRIICRPAYSFTATSVAGSRVLTITAGDILQMKVGMKLSGANLETDADDLNKHTRVWAVDGSSVTMDRAATVDGSFSLTAYVYNCGILVSEPKTNASYDVSLEYRGPKLFDLQIVNFSGDGVTIRSGRDQVYFNMVQSKLNSGYGVAMTASNDSRGFELGTGSNHLCSLRITTCSPRFVACDIWEPIRCDTEYSLYVRKARECIVSNSDISSTVYAVGFADDRHSVVHLNGCNLKVKTAGKQADGKIYAIVTADDAMVVVNGGLFRSDRSDGTQAEYVAYTKGIGAVYMTGQMLEMTPVTAADQTATAYKIDVGVGGNVGGMFYDTVNKSAWVYGAQVFNSSQSDTTNSERFETMVAAASHTINSNVHQQHYEATLPIASFSTTLPPNPKDRQDVEVIYHQQVTTLTFAANTGQTLNSSDTWPTSISTKPTSIRVTYRADTATWYRIS